MDEAVCRRQKCHSDKKRMRWWNGYVEATVRKKNVAYKRWIQVQTSESRDEYHRAEGSERCSEEGQNKE